MKLTNVENFIFDVDGTLYSQKIVRLKMFFRLIFYYGLRFYKLKELYALYYFRSLREIPECKDKKMEDLYVLVNKKCNIDVKLIEQIIEKWMFIQPLDLLKKYRYRDVLNFIDNQHKLGKKIIIYSDYPATEKLRVLKVKYDSIFVSGRDEIIEQKPSLKAMQKIISTANIKADRTIYIGDRDDRDKISAEYVNMKYYDIKQFRKLLKNS